MAKTNSEPDGTQKQEGWFPSTHWSQVLSAGQGSSTAARDAFGRLYENYLPPLRAFLRQQGKSEPDIQDILQGFFASLLERKSLASVQPVGKFRSWLLTCLKHYLSDQWDKQRARKRGGGAAHVAIGQEEDDAAPIDPPHPGRSPDQEFDRQFALRFIELVIEHLEQEYRARNKRELFQGLLPHLLEKKGLQSHAELGAQFNLAENTVSQEISRLRKRYRTVFDLELEKLVGQRGEITEEKQFLFAALRS